MSDDKLLKAKPIRITPNKKKSRHIVRNCILGVLAVGIFVAGIYAYLILIKPSSLFNNSTLPVTTPTPAAPTSVDPNVTPLPSPTPVPTEPLPRIVNVLLIGIDRYVSGGTSSGTMFHADTMMVAAVNFDAGTVDLISLPRDTLSHIPGIKGIYKLNASVNLGSEVNTPNSAGFMKVCDSAEWMLGGISVDYYYALQYDSLVNLVDSIGGVDYDVDIKSSVFNKGMQHLDGAKVLKYLRARTDVISGGANDKSRVNRQKKMLVAIFNKLKSSNMLTSVPALLTTVSNVYSNVSTEQTLALMNFVMNIEPASIGQYSLSGEYLNVLSWNFTIVNQENRVAVIKDVYNLDVPQYTDGTYDYGVWLGKHGFPEWKYLATADKVNDFVTPLLTGDAGQQAAYNALKASYTTVENAYAKAAVSLSGADTAAMETAMADLKSHTIELAAMFGYSETLDWTVSAYWWNDLDINEIYVDFG